jgi:hypothetical protein
MDSENDEGNKLANEVLCPKEGRELLEMFLELGGVNNDEVRQWFEDWIKEFDLDKDKLSTEDLRLLATCFLERVSSDLIHSNEDSDSYFMLPQA